MLIVACGGGGNTYNEVNERHGGYAQRGTTMTSNEIKTMFENANERKDNGYKTGFVGRFGASVDWFITRTKKHEPVFRVQWTAPTVGTRKVFRGGYWVKVKVESMGTKEQRFPFTVDGLEAAIKFAETI